MPDISSIAVPAPSAVFSCSFAVESSNGLSASNVSSSPSAVPHLGGQPDEAAVSVNPFLVLVAEAESSQLLLNRVLKWLLSVKLAVALLAG